ncbi:MAG: peptidoglycan-binding protein [Alphaproteobacteria bacterium]|nr:peptidoglycan-binding protein [Alphaproteobacteria bacterium]
MTGFDSNNIRAVPRPADADPGAARGRTRRSEFVRGLLLRLALIALAAGILAFGAIPATDARAQGSLEVVKSVQNALAARGYDVGQINGYAGSKTTSAIRRYQKNVGLPVDGTASRALLRHMNRETVRALQLGLAARGYDPGAADGLVGRKTVRAIRLYQSQSGLKVDGKPTQALANHMKRETVAAVQRMLAERDYDPGPADGFSGRKTRAAIRDYQAAAGLKVDGKATDALADHMVRETVRSVQRMLAVLGYDAGIIDGLTGEKTTTAIREYQEQAGLEIDGEPSQKLLDHLTRETVKSAQRMLAARGYDPGPTDGYPGRKTTTAIRDYQTRAGLPVDGKVSLILLEHLNASAGISARDAPYAGPGDVVIGYQRDEFEPVYEVGDAFAYSDGRVETVLRVGSDRVWWRTRAGDNQTAHRNFILPRIAWQTGAGSGEATVGLDADDAWPSTRRKAISFGVSVFWTPAEAPGTAIKTTETWGCRRKARERVSVAAGTFETIPVVCKRSNPRPGTWHTRVWYYAPAVRHYVRRDDLLDGVEGVHRVELVAIRPGGHDWPPAVRAGLEQGVQDMLENGKIGTESRWGSTAVGEAFVIKATGEVDRPDGVPCRTFVLVRSQAPNPRAYPAVACRSKDSDPWLVPVLDQDKGAVGPLVVN